MAQFKIAFAPTLGHEGGYAKDPDDFGGETYCGIARRYHPTWAGWGFIDALKGEDTFPLCLDRDDGLQYAVSQFYKELYWDRFQGDKIPDQALANELFDTAVNMGVHRAVVFLQSALNLLNRNEKLYSDIMEDGQLGPASMRSLEGFLLQDGNCNLLVKLLNVMQGNHYIEQMRKHSNQEKYLRGWFKRVAI